MSKKFHKPGEPLKTPRVPARKKAKVAKAHKKPLGKDWFGSAPGIKDAEHM